MKKLSLTSVFVLSTIYLTAQQQGTFTDTRDNKTYKTVTIGSQTWLAENLSFNATSGTKCYQNNPEMCKKYGVLYTWDAALSACPAGWHLPSDIEWQTMVEFLGGEEIAGGKLKATGTWTAPTEGATNDSGIWTAPNEGATNESGFNALPAGCYFGTEDEYDTVGINAYFWTSTPNGTTEAKSRYLYNDSAEVGVFLDAKTLGWSVRCVKTN